MMSAQSIGAVVFDVGETLVDETRAWGELADAAGVTRLTLFAALGALIERGEDHRRILALLGVPRPEAQPGIRSDDLYPDAAACLSDLHAAGYRIGLAGNQPAEAAHTLCACGLAAHFIATSGEWGVEKPAWAFFAHVTNVSGIAAHRIVYVGDRLDNDVLPAQAYGMRAVFIRRGPWGHIHADRPEAAQADAQIDSLTDLPAIVAALAAGDGNIDGEREMLAVAVDLACRADRGQRYPSPQPEPFIQHPLRVMNAVHGARAQATAVLHDVLEDTTVTADELRAAKLPAEVVEATIVLPITGVCPRTPKSWHASSDTSAQFAGSIRTAARRRIQSAAPALAAPTGLPSALAPALLRADSGFRAGCSAIRKPIVGWSDGSEWISGSRLS
jgi:FMN phosphatase YigB (HAD superfamily)